MSVLFDVAVAVVLALVIGIPVVQLFDGWKKEMEADEKEREQNNGQD